MEFLQRFKSSKKRDLTWVQSFVSKTSEEDSSTVTQTEEWLNRNPETVGEEQADRVCQALIKMSEEQFGYTAETCTHPIEILSTWLYKRHLGVRHGEKKSKTETWTDKASVSSNKAVTAGGPSSSSSEIGGVDIKVEHPQLVELRGRVVVGKSTKSFLERRCTEGKDLLSLFMAKSKTQTALQMQADQLRTAMAALEQHISNLRAVVAEVDLAQNDDITGDVRNRLECVISHSEAHQDGDV